MLNNKIPTEQKIKYTKAEAGMEYPAGVQACCPSLQEQIQEILFNSRDKVL